MSHSRLTQKQAYYLKRFQEAQDNGLSLRQLAEQEKVKVSVLYNYRYTLRRKGVLDSLKPTHRQRNEAISSFTAVPVSPSGHPNAETAIELKTQLSNGQPVWMTVPASQLGSVLAALSA